MTSFSILDRVYFINFLWIWPYKATNKIFVKRFRQLFDSFKVLINFDWFFSYYDCLPGSICLSRWSLFKISIQWKHPSWFSFCQNHGLGRGKWNSILGKSNVHNFLSICLFFIFWMIQCTFDKFSWNLNSKLILIKKMAKN